MIIADEAVTRNAADQAQQEKLEQKDIISRDTYKRIKHYDREQLSGYLKALYHKAFGEGYKLGKLAAGKQDQKEKEARTGEQDKDRVG